MKNKLTLICSAQAKNAKLAGISKGLKLAPLTRSIREIIALGGLALASSCVWAEAQINSNEIWLSTPTSSLNGICANDIDQDGDLDLFAIHYNLVTMFENTGNPMSPEFALPVPFISNQGNFKLSQLGILGNCLSFTGETFVDIDADGDLDLFSRSYDKNTGTELFYSRNDGTTEHPVYVDKNSQEEFGFQEGISSFMFKDIDRDGDQDLWSNFEFEPVFFENTGSPEDANFVERRTGPIQSLCNEGTGLGFIIDLNNDGQWDMLCQDYEGNIEYFESSNSGFLPKRNLFVNTITIFYAETHALDIDSDGDTDIISGDFNEFVLFTNVDSELLPQFDSGSIYPFVSGEAADLDGDGDFDIIDHETLAYARNTGSNINPAYELSRISTELEQCNNSFLEIADANRVDPGSLSRFIIQDIALVDIDGDNDLDLFSHVKFSESNAASSSNFDSTVFCENVGNATSPLFAPGLLNAFGLKLEDSSANSGDIFFSDMDGDGDQDVWVGSVFYDNVGNSTEALFHHFDNLLFFPDQYNTTLLDIDGDSRVDSALNNSRLLHKGLEPATDITVTALSDGMLVIATNRPSQVQLQICSIYETDKQCGQAIVLPGTSQKLSLSAGDFTGNGRKDIVLAMIDAEGHLKIEIFDENLKFIGSGSGGTADSVSVSTGQLDDDPEDEFVVSLVQADNRVAAIAFNLDGSRVGKVVANEGKQPTVDVGKFAGTGDAYVLAYLTPDDRLETAVLQADGTLIGQGGGGHASHIIVSAAELSSSNKGDEYAISLVQADGTVALISFAANGTRLGKVVGGISHQPKVISANFSGDPEQSQLPGVSDIPGSSTDASDTSLAVSVILSDKKPAIIFLDNKGKHLGTGLGGVEATVSTIELVDTNFDGIDDTGVLIYLDEAGNPRIGLYGIDGKKREPSNFNQL